MIKLEYFPDADTSADVEFCEPEWFEILHDINDAEAALGRLERIIKRREDEKALQGDF